MKKILFPLLALVLLITIGASPALAAKPEGNLAGAEKVEWNLSADVAKVPPYGTMDIPGSDTASKLIVNRPNGNNIAAAITGAMNGLNPDTTYTVYLSNGYMKNIPRWSLIGDWTLDFIYGGSPYIHDMTVTLQQLGGSFQGTGSYVTDPSYTWTVTGTITGSSVSFHILYTGTNAGYYIDAVGTIDSDGDMSGNWNNASQSGTWSNSDGEATFLGMVCSGHPGLFNNQQPFTFTTDEYGAGCWHVNLKNADLPGKGTFDLSVWINGAGKTILISDTFSVTSD